MPDDKTAGQALIESLTLPGDKFSLTVLVIEAGRIADRLQGLHDLLSGEQRFWARLVDGRDDVVEVRIDNALPEAARQAVVLKQLLAEIARIRALTPAEAGDDDLAGL